jgi:hypothetical protein
MASLLRVSLVTMSTTLVITSISLGCIMLALVWLAVGHRVLRVSVGTVLARIVLHTGRSLSHSWMHTSMHVQLRLYVMHVLGWNALIIVLVLFVLVNRIHAILFVSLAFIILLLLIGELLCI